MNEFSKQNKQKLIWHALGTGNVPKFYNWRIYNNGYVCNVNAGPFTHILLYLSQLRLLWSSLRPLKKDTTILRMVYNKFVLYRHIIWHISPSILCFLIIIFVKFINLLKYNFLHIYVKLSSLFRSLSLFWRFPWGQFTFWIFRSVTISICFCYMYTIHTVENIS